MYVQVTHIWVILLIGWDLVELFLIYRRITLSSQYEQVFCCLNLEDNDYYDSLGSKLW